MNLIIASLFLLQLLSSSITASDVDGEAAPRIVGGDRVEDSSKYPSFAIVRARRREADGVLKTSFCGGVLVSQTAVLVSVG
jgi:secreted trypsin-like serine protease